MGAMNGDKRLPKPQIIHPYYFGDEFQKLTCLWLKGLKKLLHTKEDNLFEKKTHVGKGQMFHYPNGKKQPQWIADTSTSRANEKNRAIRSKTFPGIARQMAEQWSLNLLKT